jgi:glutaredoxin-related protein
MERFGKEHNPQGEENQKEEQKGEETLVKTEEFYYDPIAKELKLNLEQQKEQSLKQQKGQSISFEEGENYPYEIITTPKENFVLFGDGRAIVVYKENGELKKINLELKDSKNNKIQVQVRHLKIFPDGTLVVANQNRIYIFEPKGYLLQTFDKKKQYTFTLIQEITLDQETDGKILNIQIIEGGKIIITTTKSIIFYDYEEEEDRYVEKSRIKKIDRREINNLLYSYYLPEEKILILTKGKLILYSPSENKVTKEINIPDNYDIRGIFINPYTKEILLSINVYYDTDEISTSNKNIIQILDLETLENKKTIDNLIEKGRILKAVATNKGEIVVLGITEPERKRIIKVLRPTLENNYESYEIPLSKSQTIADISISPEGKINYVGNFQGIKPGIFSTLQ